MAKHPPHEANCACPICLPEKYGVLRCGQCGTTLPYGYFHDCKPVPNPRDARIQELEEEVRRLEKQHLLACIEAAQLSQERDGARKALEDRDQMHAEHVQAIEAQRMREVAELRGALEFYASRDNYAAGSAKQSGHISQVESDDWGNRARKALGKGSDGQR